MAQFKEVQKSAKNSFPGRDPFGFCDFQYSCNESINYDPVNLIIIWTFYRSKTDCYGKHETLLEINSQINCMDFLSPDLLFDDQGLEMMH